MIGELYSRLLDGEPIPAISELLEDLIEFIFQDDEDSNHLTEVAMNINYDCFAEIWTVENILRFLKEQTREKTFANFDSLVDFINSQWHKITPEQ